MEHLEKELPIHGSISQSVFSGSSVPGRLMDANIKQSVLCSDEFFKTWVNQVKLVSAELLRTFNIVCEDLDSKKRQGQRQY